MPQMMDPLKTVKGWKTTRWAKLSVQRRGAKRFLWFSPMEWIFLKGSSTTISRY